MTRLINQDGRDVTSETVESVQKIVGQVPPNGSQEDLRKASGTITLASGLVAYDLEAPAKNLYPVLTPLRNMIPRKTRGAGAGDAVHWKEVSAIAAGGVPSMSWVPEGQRAPRMTVTTVDRSATYRTIGIETDVTFEAQSAGAGFEDVLGTAGVRLLQQQMILEEYALMGGNASVALGQPASFSAGSAAGGSLSATTYWIGCFPLTEEGYLAASVTSGVTRQVTVTGMDNATYVVNGGSGIMASGSVAVGATGFLTGSVTPVKGAVAYAWYAVAGSGSAGAKCEAITTTAGVALKSLAGTGAAIPADQASDFSRNATLAFDGLLYVAANSSLAYRYAMPNGSGSNAGTGTGLTADGHGGIVEINTALRSFWDSYRLSPDYIFVNAQEAQNILSKMFTGTNAAALVRYNIDSGGTSTFEAGQVVTGYLNPFTVNGGQSVKIQIHPNLPPGTILFWCQNLPAYYQSANVPQVAEVQCRRDYYQIPWPIITRSNSTGVYSEEVLKVYAPFALGVITNIGNA